MPAIDYNFLSSPLDCNVLSLTPKKHHKYSPYGLTPKNVENQAKPYKKQKQINTRSNLRLILTSNLMSLSCAKTDPWWVLLKNGSLRPHVLTPSLQVITVILLISSRCCCRRCSIRPLINKRELPPSLFGACGRNVNGMAYAWMIKS